MSTGNKVPSLPDGEDERFEFKSSRTPKKELKEKLGCAISAFANARGGTFVAGVDNETQEADGGFAISDFCGRRSLREWIDDVLRAVAPPPRYEIRLFDDPDGRGTIHPGNAVFLVSVEESHAGPHMALDNCYYIRLGSSTQRAPHYIVEALWAKRHFAKPRLTHLIRQDPNCPETIQIGLVALTDSPAIDVEVAMQPLPGLYRGHDCTEFPVTIGVIDRHTPFFFEITTRYDAEHNREEEFDLTVNYSDLASNRYTHESRINLFRALPSLRSGRKGLNEIAKALESVVSMMSADIRPPLPHDWNNVEQSTDAQGDSHVP